MRKWFDVIVIDGPPALEAGYAKALAAQADTTIFVVEWDKTRAADAEHAIERLESGQIAVLFNKTDVSRLRLYDPEQSRQIESLRLVA